MRALSPDEWRLDASCRGATNLMYDEERIEEAQAVCASCVVTQECAADVAEFEHGKAADNRFGVWAGTTPLDRYTEERRKRE